jgi:hypothetical protein
MPNTRLDNALLSFTQVSPHFGPADEAADQQRDQFRKDLRAISESTNRYFVICVALVLILFAGACALGAFKLNHPAEITAVFGATGLSFSGIFRQMLRLWKEKVNTEMLIALAGNLETADLRKMALALLKARLSGGA